MEVIMKRLALLTIVFLTVLCTAFASGAKESAVDNSLQAILDKGTFVLGLDDSFPPMGYRNENNEIVGFDIDVAREVCKLLGVELVLQPIDWNSKEQELNTKQIDCIWNGFTVTEERKKALTFSESYVENAQVVIVKSDSSYKSLSDLAGKTVGLQAGSSAAEAVDDSPEFKASLKGIVEFTDNLKALMDLEIGGCDAVVMDLLVANYAIAESGKDFVILDESLVAEEYAIGFRKGENALANAVNEKMKELVSSGKMAEIATAWFGADITIIGK